MQLKITTDYAVRAILYLAMQDGRVVSSSEVAEVMGIPRKYLIQIGAELKKAGLIRTHTGVQGGYSLAREAGQILLFDIAEVMESTTRINRCLEPDGYCSRSAAECPIKRCYCGMQELWDDYLKGFSVARMLEQTADEKRRVYAAPPPNLPEPD